MKQLIQDAINSGTPISMLPFGTVGVVTFNAHRLPDNQSRIEFWGGKL